ncbi:hypothetical protein DSECCO2_659800 [anaerobic digester metagenome]
MATIIKVRKPFALKLGGEYKRREFPVGVHSVSPEELEHWFMKAVIAEGRADVVFDKASAPEDEAGAGDGKENEGASALVSPTRDDLLKLKAEQLKDLCVACGMDVPEGATKAVLADMLLAGQDGVALVKGADGVLVQVAGPGAAEE